MKPYKCPICNGTGIVPGGFYLSVNGYSSTSTATAKVCRQCQGSGIVWGIEDCDCESLTSNNVFGEALKDAES